MVPVDQVLVCMGQVVGDQVEGQIEGRVEEVVD